MVVFGLVTLHGIPTSRATTTTRPRVHYDPKAMRINRGSLNKASPKRKAKRDPDESGDDEDDEDFEIKVSSRVSCSDDHYEVLIVCSVRTISPRSRNPNRTTNQK
jgi:hypothetical protein